MSKSPLTRMTNDLISQIILIYKCFGTIAKLPHPNPSNPNPNTRSLFQTYWWGTFAIALMFPKIKYNYNTITVHHYPIIFERRNLGTAKFPPPKYVTI